VTGVGYSDLLAALAPETALVLAAVAVLFVDMGLMRSAPLRQRFLTACAVAGLGCLVTLGILASSGAHLRFLDGVLVVDSLTQWVKVFLVVLTLFTAGISAQAEFTEHVGEYFALVLLATVGMMFLVSTEEILMIFVSLELTSLSLYVLAALDKRTRHASEAALKYFLFGSVAAAFTLFGLSLVYGLSGATNLTGIAAGLRAHRSDPLLAVAVVMVIMGFGFKVAVVPFHLWAPDAYEGAPVPAAALIASGSKVASFFVLAKIAVLGFAGVEGSGAWGQLRAGWLPVLAVLAVGSMVLGNLTAIAQGHLRRLLAYSAIAHAGYVLLGLMAMGYPSQRSAALAAVLYYVATYGLTTVGAFGVASVIERVLGNGRIDALAGLSRRSPLLALCLMVFLLSLAGIPPLAGFFGKFGLFTAAMGADPAGLGLLWLVGIAIAMSTVSLYYYLRVLKQAYVVAGDEEASRIVVPWTDRLVLIAAAVGVFLLGALPELLLGPLARAIAGGNGF